jgi:hypothetical protein
MYTEQVVCSACEGGSMPVLGADSHPVISRSKLARIHSIREHYIIPRACTVKPGNQGACRGWGSAVSGCLGRGSDIVGRRTRITRGSEKHYSRTCGHKKIFRSRWRSDCQWHYVPCLLVSSETERLERQSFEVGT